MLKFNYKKLKEKQKELTQFKGWLPFILELYIDIGEREDYLKSIGLYDDIEQANQDYMRILRYCCDDPQKFMEDLTIEFVNDNPQFKGIID